MRGMFPSFQPSHDVSGRESLSVLWRMESIPFSNNPPLIPPLSGGHNTLIHSFCILLFAFCIACTACDNCPAGQYKATAGVNIACDECEAGKYSAVAAATVCRNCEAGKYKGAAGVNTACDNCVAGKYKVAAGVNTACDDCQAGKYKTTAGVNTACDNCEAGKYKATQGVNTACDESEATARCSRSLAKHVDRLA